jgi:ATPase subunit of ABC transporter with duplicated ATPase domains
LMSLDFLRDATNVILVGPNGVGKSTLARNLDHQALVHGHTVLFTSAGQLLGDLAALDSDSALRRRLRHYARPISRRRQTTRRLRRAMARALKSGSIDSTSALMRIRCLSASVAAICAPATR